MPPNASLAIFERKKQLGFRINIKGLKYGLLIFMIIYTIGNEFKREETK